MYSKVISVLLLITICCLSASSAQTDNAKCAEIDEYCQNHWDCCSGSCLSFQYKCVRSNPPAMVNLVGADGTPASGADLANRFGATSNTPTTPSPDCARSGQYCQTHGECCSQSCLTFSHKCIGDTVAARPQNPLFTVVSQQPGNVELGERFGETIPLQSPIYGASRPTVVNSTDDLIGTITFNQD